MAGKCTPLTAWVVSAALALGAAAPALAVSWSDITNQDAVAGLKSALNTSTLKAVEKLAVANGFWNNPKVKIPLPGYLEDARGVMNAMGMKKQAEELHLAINRAAESAVGEAKPVFVNAIKSMSVQDAKGIISGGQDSGTQFFKSKTSDTLRAKFLPIVKKATERVGLAQKYNDLASRGSKLGLIKGDQASVETFVTQKALDGLFLMMAEEEKAIRADPVGKGTDIVKKVFGALGK
ncbi:MAG: DUF4197 domain-containing protein [Burkholderiales bacterium]|nr:DUF4197 domain-containing protein [Burkholderiales bacterium]